MTPPKRKKWTEAEEKTLIEKYGEMASDGTLAKMKTREKKFKPIALHVSSAHHTRDPVAFPWQWTWKDVSTKVQNMRHQYLLVKQKIKKPESSLGEANRDEYDWDEGLTHWSNFLRYKDVFGDVAVTPGGSNDTGAPVSEDPENGGGFVGEGRGMEIVEFEQMGHDGDEDFIADVDGGENGMIGLGFSYEGEEREENIDGNDRLKMVGVGGFPCEEVDRNGSHLRRKKKVLKRVDKKAWGFVAKKLQQLKQLEAQFEQREMERERKRERIGNIQMEREREWEQRLEEREKEREERERKREELRRKRMRECEVMMKENEERERRRREEVLIQEREWEQRMDRKRSEWKNRIDEMLSQHRAEMSQIQTRILHEQQNLTGQLLGIVSQWTGHTTGLSDQTGAGNHYLSQVMQNLHHVNGMVHGDARIEGDNHDDQFIVDG